MVLQQMLTLAAVLVGAGATFLFGRLQSREAWRREQANRWQDRRAVAYAEYAASTKRIAQVLLHMASALDLHAPLRHPGYRRAESDEELRRQLFQAHDQRGITWEAVLLVGSPDAVEAGRAWHTKVWSLERGLITGAYTSDTWNSDYAAVGALRDAFYATARLDLQAPGTETRPSPTQDHS